MKRMFIYLLILSLTCCKETFNPNAFKGIWAHYDNDENYGDLPYITFKRDSVYLQDIYSYVIKGKYKITTDKIYFYFKKDTLKHQFRFNQKDSTIIIKNHKYLFWEGYSPEFSFKDYELINIKKENKINSDSLLNYGIAIHIYRDLKDSLKLKLNDKTTSDFNLIPRFAFQRHKPNESIVIYIGDKIKLKDIIKCYIELTKINIKQAFLLTEFDLKENNYSGFLDDFEIWNNQINLFSKEKYEPYNSIELSQKKYKLKNIRINSGNDFFKLLDLNIEDNYLIQINPNLNLEAYIKLKEIINKIRLKNNNSKIRTEFNIYQKTETTSSSF